VAMDFAGYFVPHFDIIAKHARVGLCLCMRVCMCVSVGACVYVLPRMNAHC
jgi:hypothetical protein